MSILIKLKRGLSLDWFNTNPILAIGEPGFETNTGRLKIGNGSTPWNSLPYSFIVPSGLIGGDGIDLTYSNNSGTITISAVADSNLNYEILSFSTASGYISENIELNPGQVSWNADQLSLDYGLSTNPNTPLHIGQELLYVVHNATGDTLYAGMAVYASGVAGAGQRISVSPYISNGSIDQIRFVGIVRKNIPDGEDGYVTQIGYVDKLDTRSTISTFFSNAGENWTVGTILYPDPINAGKLTKNKPAYSISVAIVTNVNSNNGRILVRPILYPKLEEVHNVLLSGLQNNDILLYNSSTQQWKNIPIVSGALQGVQGVSGIQGAQGFQGIMGFQGTIGLQGISGYQGTVGNFGTQGTQGLIGVGLQGIQGFSGTQGYSGIQGFTGLQGLFGLQGIQGISGIQGLDGAYASQGIQGISGIQGLQGFNGLQGTIGIQGFSGIQGYRGWQGLIGIQGIIGAASAQGASGIQGSMGLTGNQGIQGINGAFAGQGIQGISGVQGLQGIQGEFGFQGVAGTSQGAQGTFGLQGRTGSQGLAGIFGGIGVQGFEGAQGSIGYQGLQGVFGSQGLDGAYAGQGIQGSSGIQGYNGSQGIAGSFAGQGIQGEIGIQGYSGLQGIYGYQGIQGIAGIQGGESSQGAQGLIGYQGVQGTQGLAPFRWIGQWIPFTIYYKDNVIEHNGSSFICTIEHTSSADFDADELFGYWDLMVSRGYDGIPGTGTITITAGTGIIVSALDPFAIENLDYIISTSALISSTGGITGASKINNIISLSQSDYDAIVAKDSGTLYIVIPQ